MELPDCNLTIYNLEVKPSDEIRPYQKIPPDLYRPQDIPNTSSQSSVIYGTVGSQRQEGLLQIDGNSILLFTAVTDQQGSKPSLAPTLDTSPDTDLRPLLLNTVRDADGKLRLTIQLCGSEDEEQKTPFLSDSSGCRTWLPDSDDSGCDGSTPSTPTQPSLNSHYCPPQPQLGGDTLISGYKQNWMPENLIQPEGECGGPRVHYPRAWSGLKQAKDNEEDQALTEKDMCMRSENPLSSWMVQVQD